MDEVRGRTDAREPIPADTPRVDAQALLSTIKAATTMTNQLEAVLREAGVALRANEYDALVFLVSEGPIRLADLLRLAALTESPATLHAILARLEDRGFAARGPHPDHARSVLYSATDDGVAAIRQVWPSIDRHIIRRFAANYSDEELAQLADLAGRI
jgi:DNA-binding MarR family transcriptional regulator